MMVVGESSLDCQSGAVSIGPCPLCQSTVVTSQRSMACANGGLSASQDSVTGLAALSQAQDAVHRSTDELRAHVSRAMRTVADSDAAFARCLNAFNDGTDSIREVRGEARFHGELHRCKLLLDHVRNCHAKVTCARANASTLVSAPLDTALAAFDEAAKLVQQWIGEWITGCRRKLTEHSTAVTNDAARCIVAVEGVPSQIDRLDSLVVTDVQPTLGKLVATGTDELRRVEESLRTIGEEVSTLDACSFRHDVVAQQAAAARCTEQRLRQALSETKALSAAAEVLSMELRAPRLVRGQAGGLTSSSSSLLLGTQPSHQPQGEPSGGAAPLSASVPHVYRLVPDDVRRSLIHQSTSPLLDEVEGGWRSRSVAEIAGAPVVQWYSCISAHDEDASGVDSGNDARSEEDHRLDLPPDCQLHNGAAMSRAKRHRDESCRTTPSGDASVEHHRSTLSPLPRAICVALPFRDDVHPADETHGLHDDCSTGTNAPVVVLTSPEGTLDVV